MTLELQLPSFIFGLIIGLALMLVIGQSYRFLFGNRRLHELGREVNRLRKIIDQKDRYIKKSLEALKKEGIELRETTTGSEP